MKTIIAGALGECVHVAGVSNFLRLAELAGWRTIFLGPAVSIEDMISAAIKEKADMVGVSYRLTPETGERLLAEFTEAADELRDHGVRFVFGGTPPVADKAQASGFFEKVFSGKESDAEVVRFLRDEETEQENEVNFPKTTIERIKWKTPYPLLRHHFGLPTMQATIDGIQKISEAQVLDVISLGIDQDAQENFFHPERQDPRRKGAGGVPVRSAEDYQLLYEASRCGNFPMVRTYSGTDDFIQHAEIANKTINNAWCAIPLFWFNQMDGRGPWDLEGSIREHQKVMAWYGERNIPVELNEPHHWGMRDAPDVIYVVAAYLSAYNARAMGVKDYIAQFMFNSPPGLSDAMDLAKMLAILEMIQPLENENFKIWRQTRTGLLSYPVNPIAAIAQLATSVYLQMALKPHIVHVVGYCEADHAATAKDVIESCQLAQRAIENSINGAPDMTFDPAIQSRIKKLVSEASLILEEIKKIKSDSDGGLVDPQVLATSVLQGILDAPQLKNNRFGRGAIRTQIVNGCCEAINLEGNIISETKRLHQIRKGNTT
ncbi:MAG: cobalamin B12-binding domain-containing protein [Anaerolineaceae bacterium]|nr:cobalamin B12-binding domain-containing protein [Anaerolineaceae bacterium]